MAAIGKAMKFPFRNLNSFKTGVLKMSGKNLSLFSARRAAYDPDGRTVVSVMNSEDGAPLMINSYSVLGFRLNNNAFIIGPVAIFPHSILSWNIKDDYDINEKSLSLFLRLSPRLDVLLIGLSDAKDTKLINDMRSKVRAMLGDMKQGDRPTVEVLPTEKAVTTFNFLNSESRFVAAALVPPVKYSATLDDEFRMDHYLKKKGQKEILLL